MDDGELRAARVWSRAAAGGDVPLLARVQSLFRTLAWDLRQLDAVAAARGPGSFTGIRVGLAMAAGIAYGRGIPLYGLESMSILLAQAPAGSASVVTVRDAGRGEVFAWRPPGAAIRLRGADLARWLQDGEVVIADPASLLGVRSPSLATREVPLTQRRPLSEGLARHAHETFLTQNPVRYHEVEAIYIQPAAAEETQEAHP